jgi:hypothetical protein
MSDLEKLALLRKPFPANQISKLPKPTKQQTIDVKNDFRKGIRCTLCGAWHHKDVIHLDYVGHAALTDRLLDCDIEWKWEPFSLDSNGLPLIKDGGLWIKLTVCGVTRPGYGSADGKEGGDAVKEIIGDALRNAAMRFGAALDLWHKGELHIDDEPTGKEHLQVEPEKESLDDYQQALKNAPDLEGLQAVWLSIPKFRHPDLKALKDEMKAKLDDVPEFWPPEEEIL